MNKIFYLFLCCALFITESCCQHETDMGDCACICGLQSDGIEVGPGDISDPTSFLDRVHGPKGYMGRPGKPGPKGAPGRRGERGAAGPPGTGGGNLGTTLRSCLEHVGSYNSPSGIYKIKPTRTSATINVYCDMSSAGGGWTLVASVHENNIKGKCTAGDSWSDDQGGTNYTGPGNWENYNVFGNPESATSRDYKSPAYYNLLATDVMIWHVPNDVSLDQWSSQATFKYYTENGFLRNYGGTLQSMFAKYYPLRPSPPPRGTASQGVVSILEAINAHAAEIRALIPDFYSYRYDATGVKNHISDGGGDMFDTGNLVFYQIGANGYHQITYGESYKVLDHQVEVASSAEHPFVMLMWVGNADRSVETFYIKVQSGTGADGSGSYATYTGELVYESFTMHYKAFNVYSANDPSISEVFFYVESTDLWNSVPPSGFTASEWSRATDNLRHTMEASGRPSSILMGYTLLSRDDDYQVLETHVRSALERMLHTISTFRNLQGYNCSRLSESLVVPVRFLQGSEDDMLTHVPPAGRNTVQPGYIQFHALDSLGNPNALCPGIRTQSCKPYTQCVGGTNTLPGKPEACGDFAAWDGILHETPLQDEPSGTAHSLDDISSSILIFTRGQ